MTFTQLAQLASDWRGAIPFGGCLFEEKIDGFRALRFTGADGETRLWTRNGQTIEGVGHILHRLRLMERVAGERMMFDGEFQVDGTLEATKAWCERGWKQGGEAGLFHAFDCMSLADWQAGGCDAPLIDRKDRLKQLWQAVEDDPALSWEWRPGSYGRDEGPSPVRLIPDGWAFDAQDVLAEANRVWAAGGEGLVLKSAESPYRRNRNAAWLKVKQANLHKWKEAA